MGRIGAWNKQRICTIGGGRQIETEAEAEAEAEEKGEEGC
jgi:hypothetical protein